MKVAFRSRAILVYSAWVFGKEWMFFQEYPSSVQCTLLIIFLIYCFLFLDWY